MWFGANDAPMYSPKSASCRARTATAFSGANTQNVNATRPPRRTVRNASSTQRRSISVRPRTRLMPLTCRDRPSRSRIGKKYQPWWATSQRIVRPRWRVAMAGVIAIAARATSGSWPSWLGRAWCRVCLLRHQP